MLTLRNVGSHLEAVGSLKQETDKELVTKHVPTRMNLACLLEFKEGIDDHSIKHKKYRSVHIQLRSFTGLLFVYDLSIV